MNEYRHTVKTAKGQSLVMLYDSELQGKILPEYFDPDFWSDKSETRVLAHGRGITLKVHAENIESAWVLRQYRRGGLFGRIVKESYFFSSEDKVRSFSEWRITKALYEQGLPVPRPIAAIYFKSGLIYKAAILVNYLPDTQTLSQLLETTDNINWQAIAKAIYQLHTAGLVHSDLNAHNILINASGTVTIIDLDKSAYFPGMLVTAGHRESLARLHRSIQKVSIRSPEITKKDWDEFVQAYRELSTR